MAEAWCDFGDLPQATCAHCQPPVEAPAPARRTPSGFRKGVRGLEARIRTRCPECRDDIEVGDLITSGPDGGPYIHVECS